MDNNLLKHLDLDDYHIAIHFAEYEKAIRMLESKLEEGNLTDEAKGHIYQRLGHCYIDIGQNDIAKDYLYKAFDLIPNYKVGAKASILFELSKIVGGEKQLEYVMTAIKMNLANDMEPHHELQSLCIYYQNADNSDMADEIVDEMLYGDLTRNDVYGYCSDMLEKVNVLLMKGDKYAGVEMLMDIIIRKFLIGAKNRLEINFNLLKYLISNDPFLLSDSIIAQKMNIVKRIANEIYK